MTNLRVRSSILADYRTTKAAPMPSTWPSAGSPAKRLRTRHGGCLSRVPTMKRCGRCEQEKELGAFNKAGEGRQPWCRECQKAHWRESGATAEGLSHRRELSRRGYRNRASTQEGREKIREESRSGYWRNREKYLDRMARDWASKSEPRVRAVLHTAVRSGKVVPAEACEGCGHDFSFSRREAHHEDYSKPLAVVWLCSECHGKMHGHGAK